MKHNKLSGILNTSFTWIYNLAAINLYFLILVFRGLIIMGYFPALLSVLRNIKKVINGKTDIISWKLFKEVYKEEFKEANIVGWIMVILGSVLYVNFKIIQLYKEKISIYIIFSYYVILLLYIVIGTWIFPILANYYDSLSSYFFNALVLGLTHLHVTIFFVVITFSIIYISLSFPALLLFFTTSVISFIWVYISIKPLKKIQV